MSFSEFRNVCKTYKSDDHEVHTVDGMDFEIEQSEVCNIADRVVRVRSGKAEGVEINKYPQSAETLEW